jgi:2-dehydro-3-deoxyphosphogluconate aldolase/(4S)-4-hydroxy-2-oxoglutarate aldolase
MDRTQVIGSLAASGLIAVVRASDADQALKIAEACRQGGAAAIEITFTVPGAATVIQRLAAAYPGGEILIGAGTVLDPETARVAILAGAQYVVSPCLNTDVVRMCHRYGIACMPGAMTVREVVECMETGADAVKVFPGEVLGPAFVKAVRGPIPQARLVPTGGVSLDNVAEWMKAGSLAVGVGGNLTAGARSGDYEAVTAATRRFVEAIAAAR